MWIAANGGMDTLPSASGRRAAWPLAALAAGWVTGCATPGPDREAWPPQAALSGACMTAHAGLEAPRPALLHVVLANAHSGVISRGTGFIVADSAPTPTAPLRVLTAAHVVGPAMERPDETLVFLMAPDGAVLAEARIGATAEPWQADLRDDAARRDLAVLIPRGFTDPAAEARFRALPGLPLAERQRGDSILLGMVSSPAGLDFGVSGAPVLDAQGRVRGVLTKFRVNPAARPAGAAPGALPAETAGIADPISAPSVLRALGAAGARVRADEGGARLAGAAGQIEGFPRRLCVRYAARMDEAPLPPDRAGRARLARAFAGAALE